MTAQTLNVTHAQLASIKVLFRQADTMTLYGIPYEMRPGQAPRDILKGIERSQETAFLPPHVLRTPTRWGPPADWVFLGQPAWWSTLTADSQTRIQAFLDLYRDDVPAGPNEWSTIAARVS